MVKLLYIEASPRKERSSSIEVAAGSEGEALDLQKKYMELILGFIGFTDITPVVVEPTLGKPESVAKMKAEAAERARSVAGAF
jgi:FMN-dependent NADH-azoreductase